MRLDLLVAQKLNCGRAYAKELILGGRVAVDEKILQKPGLNISGEITLNIRIPEHRFVSRGGLKLLAALEHFKIDLHDKNCLDVGSSTGGFTQCMLNHGASCVYAVDTGSDQLDPLLKQDTRVVSMEKTNINSVNPRDIGILCDFASVDVSFVSLKKVLPSVTGLLGASGEVICLIKPQFEAGRAHISKNGIVRDEKIHQKVLNDIICFCHDLDLDVIEYIPSPILGGDGNKEFLLYVTL